MKSAKTFRLLLTGFFRPSLPLELSSFEPLPRNPPCLKLSLLLDPFRLSGFFGCFRVGGAGSSGGVAGMVVAGSVGRMGTLAIVLVVYGGTR